MGCVVQRKEEIYRAALRFVLVVEWSSQMDGFFCDKLARRCISLGAEKVEYRWVQEKWNFVWVLEKWNIVWNKNLGTHSTVSYRCVPNVYLIFYASYTACSRCLAVKAPEPPAVVMLDTYTAQSLFFGSHQKWVPYAPDQP